MTTSNISNISRKKFVASKYSPNSYRIFFENLDPNEKPASHKFINTAPEMYSHPTVIPAQAVEDRNRPHGGRAATFLRENVHMLNEPIATINSNVGLTADESKQWWKWNVDPNDMSLLNNKKRSHSSSHVNPSNQTTYQQQHNHITNDFYTRSGALESHQSGLNRHAYNPNTREAVGIVPVTELKNYVPENKERVLVDRISYENIYDSREPNNYPMRGRRHGAYVIEQAEPKPVLGTQIRQDRNKGTSMWDVMHPSSDAPAHTNTITERKLKREPSNAGNNSSGQRRDPIGYFDDTKVNDIYGQPRQPYDYVPSWSNAYTVNDGMVDVAN